jgi:predicted DNA-binding helix-hairpin-helix protein
VRLAYFGEKIVIDMDGSPVNLIRVTKVTYSTYNERGFLHMVQVEVSAEAYSRIKEYATTFGVSVEYAASKAIERWMDDDGEIAMRVHLENQARKASRPKLIVMQTAQPHNSVLCTASRRRMAGR